ncbi:cytochrome c nitrite reductase small subunit [Sediminitomix flava]|uniref:Cytochrome c nitrite reductase small subunit n=1 Tax=Sediminitomix flava TaxID=379075 RepID=A0A316A085_SEDFL|nr:cytochrome c nitrite reductase small subunit [Sediminitomix flava]PWJ43057.1 cytochrome c nitrite reductase small subunit [Sediminitomix flava]
MSRIILFFIPPPRWRLPVILALGCIAGLGGYTFYISRAWSYISDDPKACINCHLMAPEYATWQHSSHKNAATCNDCHVPQDNVFSKYFFKAKDGLYHSSMFTLGLEPQVIRMHEAGQDVVQANCQRCHTHQNEAVSTMGVDVAKRAHGEGKLCWECHREVPHGRVKSKSSTPAGVSAPLLDSPTPKWLKAAMKPSTSNE